MSKLIGWFNKKTGYRYWYQITLLYRDITGNIVFNFTTNVGVSYQKDILNSRKIKQTQPLNKMESIPDYLLCNGRLQIKVDSYLGWFKKP